MTTTRASAGVAFRGGVHLGWFNATWPFARLAISDERLVLSCLFRRTVVFVPQDVVSFENAGFIPLVQSGVRIRHRRADLPRKIVFWYLGDRDDVWRALRASGFVRTAA